MAFIRLTFVGGGGGGGGPSGDPNAIAYFNPTGAALIDDAALTAAPVDQFGRPQILDRRLSAGNGPVFRQGGWVFDGDPVNQPGEGVVVYGPANGTQDAANGMMGVTKSDRFQLRRVVGGVDIGSAFQVDPTSLLLTSDASAVTAEILRASGAAYFGTVRTGGSTGPRWSSGVGSPEGVVTDAVGSLYSNTTGAPGSTLYIKESGAGNTGWLLLPGGSAQWTAGTGMPEGVKTGNVGDLYTQTDAVGGPVLWLKQSGAATNTGWGACVAMQAQLGGAPNITGQYFMGMSQAGAVPTGQLHGSNAGLQYSSDRANRAQNRYNQYGANTGAPGVTTFKSRGAFGLTASVIADDILGRWTCIGVSADNASLNLAAFFTFYAQGTPTAAFVPCRAEVELTTLAGVRELSMRLTSEGELSAKGPIGPGNGTSTGVSTGPRWRTGTGSPEGVVTGSPGDLYTNTSGGASTTLYVKESGAATNTGWVAK